MSELEVLVEGLGHPEGPDVLPDGRVVYVETYRARSASGIRAPASPAC